MQDTTQLTIHEKRVVDERNRLAERTEKLRAFQTTEEFFALPVAEQESLKKQLKQHDKMLAGLDWRISRF